jgi:hypothetical protein
MDDPFEPSELHVEGTSFDADNYYKELLAKMIQAQPLWVWAEEWQPYMLPQMRIATPIAESGREIIEQAKEEMFFAWGL